MWAPCGKEEENDNKKPWRRKADMVIHSLLKKNVYWYWIVTDSPHVNVESCKRYNAVSKRIRHSFARHLISLCWPYHLQMRRNELKYCFCRQNHAYFPPLHFWILDKYTRLYELQTASIDRISWAKTLKIINSKYTCNTWPRSAVAKTMTLHVNCPGLDSRPRKLFILLYFLVVFVLFSFFDTFNLLAGITSPHHSFARCCDKRIPG